MYMHMYCFSITAHVEVLNSFSIIHAAQILVPGVRQLHPLVQLSSVKFDLVTAMLGPQPVMSHGLL